MKKIFVMMFIAFTAVTTVSAQRKYRVDSPTNVINVLNFICDTYGQKNSQVYSVNKNPNTGIIESKEVITPFVCKKTEPHFTMIADYFHKDEPVSYQLMHIANGNLDNFFRISVARDNTVKYVDVRTYTNQEMWYMAVKNHDNPQLRDVYAIVWENMDAENVKGNVFMITSLRPDIYEKDMERITTDTFTLDGRMGEDISDSLYVFYMADTYEELNRLTMMTQSYAELKEYMKTHTNVLPMPVSKDKKFGISIDLSGRMGGRIRTVMPDGSLCKLWTNIDMVPGETYHITTHNGYYTPDSDYERRVGLYSGKSMFEGKENDDVELTGGYNDVIADTVADEEWHQAEKAEYTDPAEYLTEAQLMEFSNKSKALEENKENIEEMYKAAKKSLDVPPYGMIISDKPKSWGIADSQFKMICKQNDLLVKQFEDIINTATELGVSQNIQPTEGYKYMLEFFMKQSKALIEINKKYGYLSKEAIKCQKQVNKLAEKYMNEVRKATTNAH
ncbi:MAG: hypothetical protein KBT33_13905 [Prevotellaceae bacterium]|nr:hypothetical protein [Candidatus Minthosoma equi]